MAELLLILTLLVWVVLVVLNLWIWQKSKAQGNLLMMVGAGVMALGVFLWLVATPSQFILGWLPLIGMVVFALGFYLSVQPMVAAQLDAIKKKLAEVTAEKSGDDKPADKPAEEKPADDKPAG